MALTPGTTPTLGPYSVTAQIGAGGMGEVYQARDTKLDRDVALKILPEDFAADPDRLARFQREAKVLASLNHPNIAAIYGLEDSGETHALVPELVEGPTLQDRIAQGAIPLDEALPIAKQIAEALEAAHEQGIIHRDLKPANIKVTPDRARDTSLDRDVATKVLPAEVASDTTRGAPPAVALCALLALGGCVPPDAPAPQEAVDREDRYTFALVGDMPYYADPTTQLAPEFVAAQYAAVLQAIDDADVEFVVHVGDTNSSRVCADAVYAERFAEFEALGHPVFYTPGDNEWLECDNAGLDPMEQLDHLRAMFTQGDESLGGRRLPLERQSSWPGYETFREHVRWRFGGDLYVALHVVGGGNNRGPDAEPRAEFVERMDAVLTWMRESFELARQERVPGVVVVIHANPAWDRFNRGEPNPSFAPFLEALHAETAAFDGPVLLLHGDTHTFRVDKPFSRNRTGEMLMNLTRVETFGHPQMHWVRITASSDDVDRFDIQPMIVPPVRP